MLEHCLSGCSFTRSKRPLSESMLGYGSVNYGVHIVELADDAIAIPIETINAGFQE